MKKLIAASLFLLVLAACPNFAQPTPTPVPIPTFTAILTLMATVLQINTALPPTETPSVVSELIPQSQPASEWSGVPVMPDAVTGEGDDESYVFTVIATPQQVQEYYQRELGKLGWQSFAQGNGDTPLMFTNKASETLTVSIMVKGGQSLVLLVK